jgi:hypothetical protein
VRYMIAGQEAFDATEFAELALGVTGIDRELFAGVPRESAMERAARLDVAGEVLAELREEDPEAADLAAELLRTAPLPMVRLSVVLGGIPRGGKAVHIRSAA